MNDFKTAWDRFHPGSVPLRPRLRDTDRENWVRFHALPGSKRYADTDSERATILLRMNRLGRRVLGEGCACWLAQAHSRSTRPVAFAGLNLSFAYRFRDDEVDWAVYAGLVQWQSGHFDKLLSAIADDSEADTLWMSTETGAVFSPYDGGADLFLPSKEDVKDARSEFGEWLSQRADGY